MGRELQKKKRRSGRNPVRRKQRKADSQILGNPIIKENWNKKETLSQNYRRLGLMSKLNKTTGGTRRVVEDTENTTIDERPFQILPGTTFAQVIEEPVDEVQVEEDPATGQLRVVGEALQTAQKIEQNPLNDPLNDLEDDDNEVIQFGPLGHVGKKGTGAEFTRHLEEIAESGVRKRPRQQSEREEEWIDNLVQKHGDDYSAMFRDKRLNPMQQSVGDLKKRIKKWKLKHRND